ncbi:hypothetical protein PHLCEN_2v4363 [Hermanssonia centrifuga]|uniref:Uncharacterized protein n=1 Tax=Hermanssonia centrifuga TaxID=98765 RepID=A0A2R6PVH1_9APHY|nr:hypothetical protein PHLCEN_2v4363 [Hermanssonia centrifuga]
MSSPVTPVEEEEIFMEISPHKDEDAEKWSRTSDPTVENTVYTIDVKEEKRLVRRIDLRLMPASVVIYLLSFIDRSNIGNAKILNSATHDSLAQTLHISEQQYLVALMIYLVAYIVFETPSNYMLKKFRPSRWIALLIFSWGVMTMALGGVHNFGGLLATRFLLGLFEAGLYPGGAFGGVIAFGVGRMNHVMGLQACRWLFIIEGAPSVACAGCVFFFFPDFPETAKWLSAEDRQLAIKRIKGVASLGHAKITWKEAKETLTDWRLYLHYLIFISVCVQFSSISFFTPTIVSGLGYEGLKAQLFRHGATLCHRLGGKYHPGLASG